MKIFTSFRKNKKGEFKPLTYSIEEGDGFKSIQIHCLFFDTEAGLVAPFFVKNQHVSTWKVRFL